MHAHSNYKLIVALKAEPIISPLYAILNYDAKEKKIDLPTSEGQFFDLNHIHFDSPSQLTVTLFSHSKIGQFDVTLPTSV